MNISIFLKGREFHVFCENFEKVYIETETRNLADNIPVYISEVISEVSTDNLENLIYSSGPCSFTSIRIINSIVKAFLISFPKLKFIGISHFLTYFYLAKHVYSNGLIAIPTMRGDYFTAHFGGDKLSSINIEKISENNHLCNNPVVFESSDLFLNINLANIQQLLINDNLFTANYQFINTDLRIDYGFTPEYSH